MLICIITEQTTNNEIDTIPVEIIIPQIVNFLPFPLLRPTFLQRLKNNINNKFVLSVYIGLAIEIFCIFYFPKRSSLKDSILKCLSLGVGLSAGGFVGIVGVIHYKSIFI